MRSAAVHRTLGDIYFQLGLSHQARQQYERSLNLAERNASLGNLALAQFRLGEVYLSLNKDFSARHWFREARATYWALRDARRIRELDAHIEALEQSEIAGN